MANQAPSSPLDLSPAGSNHSEKMRRAPEEAVSKCGARKRSSLPVCRPGTVFNWQRDTSVIGALQVPSDLIFEYRRKYIELPITSTKSEFDECLRTCWNGRKLKRSFVEACDGIPPSTQCCGLINDSNQTVRDTASLLNQGWVKAMNTVIRDDGFKISCFAWTWSNPSGKARTTVLLIRFHSLSKLNFNQIQSMTRESSTVKVIMQTLRNLGNKLDFSEREEHQQKLSAEVVVEDQDQTHESSFSSSLALEGAKCYR